MNEPDLCPKCGVPLEYDEVDIGVGVQRGNPGCPACYWTPERFAFEDDPCSGGCPGDDGDCSGGCWREAKAERFLAPCEASAPEVLTNLRDAIADAKAPV